MNEDYIIERYNSELSEDWNKFVADSKNGTFLFDRRYMDYHSDRFDDMSLVVRNAKGHVIALLPGNRRKDTFHSHQGLTYGGLISDDSMTAETCLEVFDNIKSYLKENGINKIIYKSIPYIYHRHPAEEDAYAMFRINAQLISRAISSTIYLPSPIPLSVKRRQKLRKAEKADLVFSETEDVKPFISMVDENLRMRHGVGCVHTPEEMQMLRDRFPEKIRLFTAEKDGELMAGALVFITDTTVHTQYMCVNIEGRKYSALDYVISKVQEIFKDTHIYFDFGASTENDGKYLNESLIYQKEGFGGRGVCYDIYSIAL